MIIEPPQTNKKQQQIPWIEKYRPSSLDEVIAHEEIINTSNHSSHTQLLVQKFRTENRLPNLLLYGPPGTGKTSTIIALAKQMYAKSYS